MLASRHVRTNSLLVWLPLIAFAMLFAPSLAGRGPFKKAKCGDGIIQEGEQCDSGFLCITQNNVLPWCGAAGTQQQPSIDATVSFKYLPAALTVPNVWAPVYGLQISQRGQPPIALTTSYGIRCVPALTSGLATGVTIEFRPLAEPLEQQVSTASIRWTYQPPKKTSASCLAFFTVHCSSSEPGDYWKLVALDYRWIGSSVSNAWRLKLTSNVPEAYEMNPNEHCGSDCCSSKCKLTSKGSSASSCAGDLPAVFPALAGSSSICLPNGTCTQVQVSTSPSPSASSKPVQVETGSCGDGIVVAPETCDAGTRRVHITNIVLGQWYVDVSFSYLPRSNMLFNYVVRLIDINSGVITVVNVANQAYTWNCDPGSGGGVGITLGTKPAFIFTYPYFFIEWAYPSSLGTCSNYNPELAGTAVLGSLRMKYMPAAGQTYDQTYASVLANQIKPNNYCGTSCCSSTCQIITGANGSPCPNATPESPFPLPAYTCQSGVCSTPSTPSPSKSASTTATPTRTPSISTTKTATSTGTTTGTTTSTSSGSITASPSSSPTVSTTATGTGTGTTTATPTSSTSATPTPTVSTSNTATSSATPSTSCVSTATPTPTPTVSTTSTQSASASASGSLSASSTSTWTFSNSAPPSQTPTPTGSTTSSGSLTATATATASLPPSATTTGTSTGTPTTSPSHSTTQSASHCPSTSTSTTTGSSSSSHTGSSSTPPSASTSSSSSSSGLPSPSATVSSTPTLSGTPSGSVSSSTTSNSTTGDDDEDDGPDPGTIIGIGVGVGGGALLIVLLGLLSCCWLVLAARRRPIEQDEPGTLLELKTLIEGGAPSTIITQHYTGGTGPRQIGAMLVAEEDDPDGY